MSDPVGGPYVGNAKWLGASLAALIRLARPLASASQLLCTSVDGFTSGTPLTVVLDGREALLAVAMNGTALPVEHGFPGADGGTRPVRVRVRDQVGHRHRGHHVRRGLRLLGAARLVAAGADQDRVPDRRTRGGRVAPPGADAGGRSGLGAAQGHRCRAGQGRWRPVASGAAGRGTRYRHLAAMGMGVAGDARQPPARGSRYRPDRLHPDPSQAQPPPNGASGYPSATVSVGSS